MFYLPRGTNIPAALPKPLLNPITVPALDIVGTNVSKRKDKFYVLPCNLKVSLKQIDIGTYVLTKFHVDNKPFSLQGQKSIAASLLPGICGIQAHNVLNQAQSRNTWRTRRTIRTMGSRRTRRTWRTRRTIRTRRMRRTWTATRTLRRRRTASFFSLMQFDLYKQIDKY